MQISIRSIQQGSCGRKGQPTLMQRFPVQMMCWILPGTSMDLNLAGRSGARCGMCRSPSARTSTIGLGIGKRNGSGSLSPLCPPRTRDDPTQIPRTSNTPFSLFPSISWIVRCEGRKTSTWGSVVVHMAHMAVFFLSKRVLFH